MTTFDSRHDRIPPRNEWLQTLREGDRARYWLDYAELQRQATASSERSSGERLLSQAGELVGLANLDSLKETFVSQLVKEALLRTQGNYTNAAKLLGASRQQIQHLARKFELRELAEELRKKASA